MMEANENNLEPLTNIQLMIISNNQEIKANELYIRFKNDEIEKLSAKCEEQRKEIEELKSRRAFLRKFKEESLSTSNQCLQTLGEHIVLQQQEKEVLEEKLEIWENKYSTTIKDFYEKYEEMKNEYEEATPKYTKLKEITQVNKNLEEEVNKIKQDIVNEKNIRQQKVEVQKQAFYKSLIKFSEVISTYMRDRNTYNTYRQLEKEEVQLLKQYSELKIKDDPFKRRSFLSFKTPLPKMPQIKSSVLNNALNNLPSQRKYSSLLENPRRTNNYNDLIDEIKKRKINLNTSNISQIARPNTDSYFASKNNNYILQNYQTQNIENNRDKNVLPAQKREKINVIDVKVIPPFGPSTVKNNQQRMFTQNECFVSSDDQTKIPFPISQIKNPHQRVQDNKVFSYQKTTCSESTNTPHGENLELQFPSQGSGVNSIGNSQTGLTQEMYQFQLPPNSGNATFFRNSQEQEPVKNQQCADVEKLTQEELSQAYKEDNYNTIQNNSFNVQSSFNCNKEIESSPIFRNVISPQLNVSDTEMQPYLDANNGHYMFSPNNSLLFQNNEKKGGDSKNNEIPSTNFSFKFGESREANKGSEEKNNVFNMYY